MAVEALVCPSCASVHPPDERFCPGCGMPLVHTGADAPAVLDERQQRARKIKPQYSEGELVRVAVARNQVEAEFIRGLLLEEGVASIVLRPSGFDMLDFVAGGSFEIMVAASGAATAAEVLVEVELTRERPDPPTRRRSGRVIVGLVMLLLFVTVTVYMATYNWTSNTPLVHRR
jgi:RNA polymerase subunit RPABC4/transcription elongation factor Spt4